MSLSILYVGRKVEARLVFLRNEFTKGFCLLLDVLLDRNHTVLSVFDANRKFL